MPFSPSPGRSTSPRRTWRTHGRRFAPKRWAWPAGWRRTCSSRRSRTTASAAPLHYFNQAGSESGLAAIADYKQAASNAEYALDHFAIDPNAPPMAPVIAAFPEFLATRSGRSVDYPIGMFGTGAENVSIANVAGGPPGAFYTLQTADPGHPWLKVLHVDQNAAPGTYTITVTFTGAVTSAADGSATAAAIAPLTLTLDLDNSRARSPVSIPARARSPAASRSPACARTRSTPWPRPVSTCRSKASVCAGVVRRGRPSRAHHRER